MEGVLAWRAHGPLLGSDGQKVGVWLEEVVLGLTLGLTLCPELLSSMTCCLARAQSNGAGCDYDL